MALSRKALQHKREKRQRKKKKGKPVSMKLTSSSWKQWPIYQCLMSAEIWDEGMVQVVISRKINDDIVAGFYLVDMFCLGIKDCMVQKIDMERYQYFLSQTELACGKMSSVEPTYAATLIFKSLNYAKELGFKPHKDFNKAKNMLAGIPLDPTLEFVFGKDGKPFYIQGPNDSPAYRMILKAFKQMAIEYGYDAYQSLLKSTALSENKKQIINELYSDHMHDR